MSARGEYKKLAYHDPPVPQEIYIVRIFFIVLGLFILAALGIQSYNNGLFTSAAFAHGFWSLVWQVIVRVWQLWLGSFFIILDSLLFILFVFSLIKVWPLRDHQKLVVWGLKPTHSHGGVHGSNSEGHAPPKDPIILKHWTAIVKKANTGRTENLRSAVVEADALTDLFLRQSGYAGETMADRLMQISKDSIKSLDRLWDAHRLRNEIAHTPGFVVTSKDAEKALLAFRDFLKEMRAF